VTVRRVCIPELADRLVHAGHNETASKILTASSLQQDVDLTTTECAEIFAVPRSDCPPDLTELREALDPTPPASDSTADLANGLMQPEPV
jgi:hypothetical protein